MTFGEKVIRFNKSLELHEKLPKGIRVMNPFQESKYALEVSSRFYKKFYNDFNSRKLILGINPGRFGAGVTGIPFTDTKRLEDKCGIKIGGVTSHEPSSVFIYDMIEQYGSLEEFYNQVYINSVCPLGFVKVKENGKAVNYNYYDNAELQKLVAPFIVDSLKTQISFGVDTKRCYVLGAGKNLKFLSQLNKKYHLFGEIIPLEHPRYVMQYKLKDKQFYIDKYLKHLKK